MTVFGPGRKGLKGLKRNRCSEPSMDALLWSFSNYAMSVISLAVYLVITPSCLLI